MNRKDIKLLCQILTLRDRKELASLLSGGIGELKESSQYGSYWNSTLSTYSIHLEPSAFIRAKDLEQEEKDAVLSALLDIYPHGEAKPEITSIDFRVLKDYPEELLDQTQASVIDVRFEHEANIKFEFLLEQIRKAQGLGPLTAEAIPV
jgi:hypothetical protein